MVTPSLSISIILNLGKLKRESRKKYVSVDTIDSFKNVNQDPPYVEIQLNAEDTTDTIVNAINSHESASTVMQKKDCPNDQGRNYDDNGPVSSFEVEISKGYGGQQVIC